MFVVKWNWIHSASILDVDLIKKFLLGMLKMFGRWSFLSWTLVITENLWARCFAISTIYSFINSAFLRELPAVNVPLEAIEIIVEFKSWFQYFFMAIICWFWIIFNFQWIFGCFTRFLKILGGFFWTFSKIFGDFGIILNRFLEVFGSFSIDFWMLPDAN